MIYAKNSKIIINPKKKKNPKAISAISIIGYLLINMI